MGDAMSNPASGLLAVSSCCMTQVLPDCWTAQVTVQLS
jgi:hypothetical protein